MYRSESSSIFVERSVNPKEGESDEYQRANGELSLVLVLVLVFG